MCEPNRAARSLRSAGDLQPAGDRLIDAVEHRGETFTVVRRGRAIATIAPARRPPLGELRDFFTDNPPDPDWEDDLDDLRRFVSPAPTTDPWSD